MTEESDGESEGAGGHEPPAPEREEFVHDPIGHAEVRAGMSVAELVEEYGKTGFGGGHVHEAVDVTAEMFDNDVTTLFGLAGAMVPAGMRRIVADLIRDGHVDALVTTGANLTHDAIEAIGGKHHHGREHVGDVTMREHDERLREEEIDRIYDVYLPQEHFAAFEHHLREEVFPPLEARAEEGDLPSIADLTAGLGRAHAAVHERDTVLAVEQVVGSPPRAARAVAADQPPLAALPAPPGRPHAAVNEREGVDEAPGIAATAHEHDVPVHCPAVADSVLGLQAWLRSQVSSFSLDALADMSDLNDLVYNADRAGAFVVGGGVPKNFVLQTMLVTPGAYDLAVQVTMDPPRTGGLSGATLDEARSWGKLEPDARNVSVYADATVAVPLIVAGARDRIADGN
jgi:deoxyhypusine synthase